MQRSSNQPARSVISILTLSWVLQTGADAQSVLLDTNAQEDISVLQLVPSSVKLAASQSCKQVEWAASICGPLTCLNCQKLGSKTSLTDVAKSV